MTPFPAGLLCGRYEPGELIGTGRTSEVYRVTDKVTGEGLALKVLEQRLTWDPAARSRLRREVVVSRRCQHPGIVRVHDLLCWEERAGVLQELAQGTALSALLARDGPLDVAAAIALCRGITDAVGAAHERGVVHRDLKPSNVLVDGATARIIDFGLARVAMMTTVTHTGAVLGTPGYQAPEVLHGDRADLRADLYGIGLLLFEMLAGRGPHALGRSDAAAPVPLERQIHDDALRLRTARPDVPAGLDQLVAELLHRNPEARPAGALEVLARLASLELTEPPGVPCTECGHALRSSIPLCPRCGVARRITLRRGPSHVRIRAVEDPERYRRRLRALFGDRAVRERLYRSFVAGRTPSLVLIRLIDARSAESLLEDAERLGATGEWGGLAGSTQLHEGVPLGVLVPTLSGSMIAGFVMGSRWQVLESWGGGSLVLQTLLGFGLSMLGVLLVASRQLLRSSRAFGPAGSGAEMELDEETERKIKNLAGGPFAPAIAVAIDEHWFALTASARLSDIDGERVRRRLRRACSDVLDLGSRALTLHEILSGRRLHDAARTLEGVRARRRTLGASAALDALEGNLQAEIDAIEDADRLLGAVTGRIVLAAGAFRRLARIISMPDAEATRLQDAESILVTPDQEIAEMKQLLAVLARNTPARRAPAPADAEETTARLLERRLRR